MLAGFHIVLHSTRLGGGPGGISGTLSWRFALQGWYMIPRKHLWVLVYGTMLGAYRNQSILPWWVLHGCMSKPYAAGSGTEHSRRIQLSTSRYPRCAAYAQLASHAIHGSSIRGSLLQICRDKDIDIGVHKTVRSRSGQCNSCVARAT